MEHHLFLITWMCAKCWKLSLFDIARYLGTIFSNLERYHVWDNARVYDIWSLIWTKQVDAMYDSI